MNMTAPQINSRHADDGELIAMIDDDLTESAKWVPWHVAECAECAARAERWKGQSAFVSLRIAELPVPSTDRLTNQIDDFSVARLRKANRPVWRNPGLRAAAGLILVAGVAAAGPIRSWIGIHIIGSETNKAANSASGSGGIRPLPPGTAPTVSTIGFDVQGSKLSIRFIHKPRQGTVTILAGEFDRVSVDAIGSGADESLLIMPAELQVRNSEASTANYEVKVPAVVREASIVIGSGKPQSISLSPGKTQVIRLR